MTKQSQAAFQPKQNANNVYYYVILVIIISNVFAQKIQNNYFTLFQELDQLT